MGSNYSTQKLNVKENMKIGIVTHKNVSLSKLAREYIESIKKYMV